MFLLGNEYNFDCFFFYQTQLNLSDEVKTNDLISFLYCYIYILYVLHIYEHVLICMCLDSNAV